MEKGSLVIVILCTILLYLPLPAICHGGEVNGTTLIMPMLNETSMGNMNSTITNNQSDIHQVDGIKTTKKSGLRLSFELERKKKNYKRSISLMHSAHGFDAVVNQLAFARLINQLYNSQTQGQATGAIYKKDAGGKSLQKLHVPIYMMKAPICVFYKHLGMKGFEDIKRNPKTFFGVRGKKECKRSPQLSYGSVRNKFVGVRGKKGLIAHPFAAKVYTVAPTMWILKRGQYKFAGVLKNPTNNKVSQKIPVRK